MSEPAGAREKMMRDLARELRAYQTALDGFDEAISERLDLNRTDLRCLDLISQHSPMTAGHLAQAAALTTGAVTFVLDRLEAAGFVHRRRDLEDRRRVLVEMDPTAGEEVWKLHEPLVMEFRAGSKRFNLDQLEVIRDFLRLAQEVYERHTPIVPEVGELATKHDKK